MSEYDIDKLPPLSADNPSVLGDVHMKVNEIITDLHHDHYSAATATEPGLMTATDKSKLDGLTPGGMPPMWVRVSGLGGSIYGAQLGPGVTSDGNFPTVSSCVGVRAVWIQGGVSQQFPDYLCLLPSDPGAFNNNNSLQNMNYFTATQLQVLQLTDGGPTGQNGWLINIGQHSNSREYFYWAWQP